MLNEIVQRAPLFLLVAVRCFALLMTLPLFSMQNVLLAEGQARYFKIPFEKAFDGQISFNHAMCYEMPMDLTEIDFPEITDR